MTNPHTSLSLRDTDSFRTLYDYYYPGLVVYAREYMITGAEAEDIVQDIFVNLWEKKNTLVINNLKTYLFRATQNSCLNYLSHLKVRTNYQNVILKTQKPPDSLEEDLYVAADLERMLKEAIAKLPPQRQKVFIMSRFEGKQVSEISEELGISPRTVEKHIQMSLAALRESMGGYLAIALAVFSRIIN